MRKSLLICVALLLSRSAVSAQNAGEILTKVSSVYAACSSYSDEGSAKTEEVGARGRHSYFRTTFARGPSAFRFQLWFNSDKPDRTTPWVVWKNGDEVRSQGIPSTSGVLNVRFDTALSRVAAFSAGSSLTIPQLLLPEAFRASQLFTLIDNPVIAGEEKIDGRQTVRIEGTVAGLPFKLWIDKRQYLILKSYRKVAVGDRLEESTIKYKPKLNVDLRPEDLSLPQYVNQVTDNVRDSQIIRFATDPAGTPPRLRNFGSTLTSGKRTDTDAQARATEDDVVRVETDLVVCAVLVLDAQGKLVRDLDKADFVIEEDGNPQEIAMLSLGDNKDVARSIVLVIDYSGSQLPYIRTSIEAAKTLVDKLNPKDRMAVVTDDVKLLVDFTSDKQRLKSQLELLKLSALSGLIGASDQYDALLATLNELFSREDTRPIVIFQTDGDQLESLKGGTLADPYWPTRKYSMQDILTATERTRTTVYPVISGVKFVEVAAEELPARAKTDWENRQHATYDLLRARNVPVPKLNGVRPPDQFFVRYADQWLNRQLALVGLGKFTGAEAEFLEQPGQADEIYTRVLTDIDRRYVIGYYPTNRARDGKRRKVSVVVRDHPEYQIWGQKSYFAREEK